MTRLSDSPAIRDLEQQRDECLAELRRDPDMTHTDIRDCREWYQRAIDDIERLVSSGDDGSGLDSWG